MVKHAMRYLPGLALAGLTVAVIARKKRHEPAPPASPLVSYGRACKEFGSHARERSEGERRSVRAAGAARPAGDDADSEPAERPLDEEAGRSAAALTP